MEGDQQPPGRRRPATSRRRGAPYGLGSVSRPEPADGAPASEVLPPSARLQGSPADPGPRVRRGTSRRWAGVALSLGLSLALVAAVVSGLVAVAQRIAAPSDERQWLTDSLAGVRMAVPAGWQRDRVPPVTGFTSVVRDGGGGMVMARPVDGAVPDLAAAAREAAERYSRLLLKGDRVRVVADVRLAQGHTRAMRAEYDDVVNRPAYLRVTLLTRGGRTALLVGLLQPEREASRQALDAVMSSVR